MEFRPVFDGWTEYFYCHKPLGRTSLIVIVLPVHNLLLDGLAISQTSTSYSIEGTQLCTGGFSQ